MARCVLCKAQIEGYGIKSMKTIYIVTVNGKISSEAYSTLEEAQDFIHHQTNEPSLKRGDRGYVIIEQNGYRYEIHDVKVSI